MKKQIPFLFAVLVLAALAESAVAQDHGHLYIGAVNSNQNSQLIYTNHDAFATEFDYVKTLDHAPTGTYAGYFQGNITLTTLGSTPAHFGPSSNSLALGSWIFAQIVSVEGPSGGAFAFWETGAVSPTISLPSGTTSTNLFRISETDGSPGTDPFGHFHGRRFTATQPGIYTVGFRTFDLSTNGIGGGPIHTPSSILKIYFQAGVNIRDIQSETNHVKVTFGAKAGFVWQIEATDSLIGGTNWQSIGAPLLGNDYFRQVQDNDPVEGHRFYRVNGTPFVP